MEQLVLIQEVGAYSERQYNKSKNRDTQYAQNTPYVVRGSWKHRTWEDQQGKSRHENTFYITDIQAL